MRHVVFVLLVCGLPATMRGQSPACFTNRFLPFEASRIRISPESRQGLFYTTDRIKVSNSTRSRVEVFDLRCTPVTSGPSPVVLASLPVGHYFVQSGGDRAQFAVLPADYRGASFLGTEGPGVGLDAPAVAVASRVMNIRPSYVRFLEWWEHFQPGPNKFYWDLFDAKVKASAGRKIILCIFKKPDWVPSREFIARYAALMRRAATRYAGKIYGIEIWNEPQPPGEYGLPVATNTWEAVADYYGHLLDACTKEIRAVSPSLRIVGPAWHGKGLVAETARIDPARRRLLFSFHDSMLRLLPPDYAGDYAEGSHHIVSGLQVQLPRLMPKPLPAGFLVDELGLYGKSALGVPSTGDGLYLSDCDWARGMNRAIKATVMYRAAGAEAILPFLITRVASNTNELYEIHGWEFAPNGNRGPHPKTSAYLMTCHWLDGAMFTGQRHVSGRSWCYGWRRPDGSTIVFAWCAEGHSAKLQVHPGFTATDIFGRRIRNDTLGEEPVLLETKANVATRDPLDAVAASIRE